MPESMSNDHSKKERPASEDESEQSACDEGPLTVGVERHRAKKQEADEDEEERHHSVRT